MTLSFEEDYQAGILPTFHITRDGKTVPFHELTNQHLYLAWRWFFENDRDSPVYKALQREKERRKAGLPVPEVHIGPPIVLRKPEVPEPPAVQVTCTCGAPMVLRRSGYGLFWGCSTFPVCRVTHGAHPDGRPLGRPGTPEEKKARIEAHSVFDLLWQKNEFSKKPVMKRREAYAWMQRAMGLSKDEAHIGNFDVEQCQKLIKLVNEYLEGT